MTEPDATTIEADLRAVDEALESGASGSDDPAARELQELALAVRAQSPRPADGFAAELGDRVRAGFPRARRLPRPSLPSLPPLRRPPLPVLAGVASVLAALAVVLSLGGDEGASLSGGEGDGDRRAAIESPSSTTELQREGGAAGLSDGESPRAAVPVPPAPGGALAPDVRERRIERSASLTLAADADRLDAVASAIVRLTDRYDGFVLRSSLSTGSEGTESGEFELRIPSARLQGALGELSKLAEVRARTQAGEDVTPAFVSAAERLQGARAERRSLLRRLERAPTDSSAESIRRRLDLNAGEVRGLRGELRDLRIRTDYAALMVSLRDAEGSSEISSPSADEDLGGAVDDALGSLADSLEIAIRALGVLLAPALLAIVAALGARALRRRRREAVLG
ncbi:MAG: DUF4349 domain-containing protein [Thermoleophilaceae bacterium]